MKPTSFALRTPRIGLPAERTLRRFLISNGSLIPDELIARDAAKLSLGRLGVDRGTMRKIGTGVTHRSRTLSTSAAAV